MLPVPCVRFRHLWPIWPNLRFLVTTLHDPDGSMDVRLPCSAVSTLLTNSGGVRNDFVVLQ